VSPEDRRAPKVVAANWFSGDELVSDMLACNIGHRLTSEPQSRFVWESHAAKARLPIATEESSVTSVELCSRIIIAAFGFLGCFGAHPARGSRVRSVEQAEI
jgi:hypothetical protein